MNEDQIQNLLINRMIDGLYKLSEIAGEEIGTENSDTGYNIMNISMLYDVWTKDLNDADKILAYESLFDLIHHISKIDPTKAIGIDSLLQDYKPELDFK